MKEMEAKELRIGNLLKCAKSDNFFEVSYEDLGYINDGISESKPILLTEEWLLKFGFGRSDEFEMGHNKNFNFGFYYDYHFNRFMLDCDNENDGVYIYLDHIKYVHQLQNLYFALTGTELEYNEVK